MGHGALEDNTSGSNTVAIGDSALFHQSGSGVIGNTAVGSKALYSNTIAIENTAAGYQALYSNTSGEDNTAVGEGALFSNTIGDNNTANGSDALYSNTTGSFNIAFGEFALFSGTTGTANTAEGYNAGTNVTNGSENTFVGYFANCGSGGHLTNATALGNEATVTSNNHIVIGNSSITSIGGFVNWSNLSDGRVKKNIKQNVPGLAFINKLRPITYNLDLDAADKIIALPARKDKDGKIINPSQIESDARKAKEQIVYTGFVAQDVEKAAEEVNYNFSGVDKPDNENTLYGLRYSDFVVPLVKAVQELSAKNDSLQSQNNDLQGRMAKLEMLVNQFISGSSSSLDETKLSRDFSSSAILQQNVPNPFSHTTTISFSIPANCQSAFIVINETASGETVKSIPVSCSQSQITLDASPFLSGSYSYSLIVSGKLVETKQMVLAK